MSDSMPVPRSSRKVVSPQPLPLTPSEAETLRAAVQRIIRASEAVGPVSQQPETKKSRR